MENNNDIAGVKLRHHEDKDNATELAKTLKSHILMLL